MDSRSYRLATFNCKNVKRATYDIRDLCKICDVICLQETWLLPHDIPFIGTLDTGFGYTATSAVDTGAGILQGRPHGGVALMWRYSAFQSVSVVQCNDERICAIKITSGDRSVLIVSVYMPTNSAKNLPLMCDCLSKICAIVEECNIESVFILGDFNAAPGELFYSELSGVCREQSWTCIDVDMLDEGSNTYTYVSDAHGTHSWLDHCVVTQSAKQSVIDVEVKYDTQWSDHYPLIVQCNLSFVTPKICHNADVNSNFDIKWGMRNVKQIAVYRTECNNRLKLIDFPSEFSACADYLCNDIDHGRVLDKLYSDIVNSLQDAAKLSRGSARGSRGGTRLAGWNKHVAEAHRMARSRFNDWNLCGRPKSGVMYREMQESKKVFKSRLKWCQAHQEQIQMDALAEQHSKGDFRGFWRDTKKTNSRPGLPVSVEGVSDPTRIANMFREHFSVRSPRPVGRVLNADADEKTTGFRFRAHDVAKVIKQMSRGKSPGHDGLSIEHLQHAGPHLARVLAMFFSLCVSHSYLPPEFMRTVVVPVVKNKTGDLAAKSNYRPISLATVVSKVFDGLLNTQLNRHIMLHDNQFGFRPKLSTDSAVLCLKQTIKYYTTRKTPVYACFLDLSKAFDLVCYDILWEKLESTDLPRELIRVLRYWYGHQVNSVRWAGAMSEPYRLECGVRQGGLTSPTLFNLYVNDLIGALSSRHVGCFMDGVCVNNLSYADDMALLSASICGLRNLLRICEDYARDHGLIYNSKKSQYMIFGAPGVEGPTNVPEILLNGVRLERVNNFKYLGHILTEDLKDMADMERERRALSVRANMIARRFARCSDGVKITLFRAFCTSLYTCSLWADYTEKAYSALRVQFNNAFRAVVGLPRFCSASGMFAVGRTDCFHATMRKRCASMVRRVRASPNAVLVMIADRLDCMYIRHACDRHISVPMPIRKF